MDILDIVLRIGVSAAVGAIVGIQREYKRSSAGFRTHMLVAIGASIAMLTNEFLLQKFGSVSNIDVSRMASYVISGIGFLGAGSIIKERKGVKGLTTAAGLWVTACLGITAGAGFYWASLIGSAFVFIIITFFKLIENKLFKSKREVKITVRIKGSQVPMVMKALDEMGAKIKEVNEVSASDEDGCISIRFNIVKNSKNTIMIEVSEKLADFNLVSIKIL